MARLRWPKTARNSPAEPPLEPLSPGETWRWSVARATRSPLLLATIGLVAVAVGATTALLQHPASVGVLLVGYLVETAIVGAYVAEIARDGESHRGQAVANAGRVLHLGVRRLGIVVLSALLLAITLTMLVEAMLVPLQALAHPLLLVHAGAVACLVVLVGCAFTGPIAVVDGERAVHAILDGWLLAVEAVDRLLALHVVFLLGASPAVALVVFAPSTAVVAVSVGYLAALMGLLALCLARTYVVSRFLHDVAVRSKTRAWEVEGTPTARE